VFALYNVLVYNINMTHRDLITLAKFKSMGFYDIEMKYIPEIKLNRITCKTDIKVGKGTYSVPFESFTNPQPKILMARHNLFQSVLDSLQDFNSKEYKEKVAYLETIGVKD